MKWLFKNPSGPESVGYILRDMLGRDLQVGQQCVFTKAGKLFQGRIAAIECKPRWQNIAGVQHPRLKAKARIKFTNGHWIGCTLCVSALAFSCQSAFDRQEHLDRIYILNT